MSGQSLLVLQKRDARRQPFGPRYVRMSLHRLSSPRRSIPLKAGLARWLSSESRARMKVQWPLHPLPYQPVGILSSGKRRQTVGRLTLRAFGSAEGRHRIVDNRQDFGARNAGAGADRQRMDGGRRHAREASRIGGGRKFARRPSGGEHPPERAVGPVDRLADEAVKVRIGDRLRSRAEHREAATRTVRTAEVDTQRGGENALKFPPQRLASRKQRPE